MLQRILKPFCIGVFALAIALSAPAALGQMPQQDTTVTLTAADVSQEQIEKAARIATSIQTSMRAQQMKLRKEMKKKYGNPQQMDSTQKAKAKREMRRKQMKMRKKQMKMLQQEANNENMDPKMFRRIMRATRKDSTLKKKIQSAMRAEMKKRRSQGGQGSNQQNQ